MKSDNNEGLAKPPRLIRNKPSEDDEFAGGAHTRIARSVCSLIDSDESGLAIALVGKWGSGKSTAVSIIQKILHGGLPKSGTKNAIFNFDAWAHHGDPMRRAFVEKLVRDLDSQKIVDEAEFRVDLARLRGDTVEVFRDIRTSLSIWSLFFWLAALMVPLGYMLLSPSLWGKTIEYKSKFLPSTSFDINPFYLGLMLLSSPVMLGLIAWVSMRPTLAPWKGKFWTIENLKNKRPKYENENILTLLLNKGENKRLHEITRTQDPTTLQFNEIFDQIIRSVSDSDRRLVLVIDNIDRLPPDLAMETWATMRNFFSRGIDHERRDILRCVSTVITLSTESLKRILTDSNVEGRQEIAFDQLSSDALGKTFDAVFHIPDAVASDWRSFLHEKLSIVLPELDANQLNDLYSIVEIYFSENNSQPTPRRLVTFVNEVSVLYCEWRDSVDVRSIGAYVLHRTDLSDGIAPIQTGTLLTSRMKVVMGDLNWRMEFAVLHLHLPQDKVVQAVLGQPMRLALENGDSAGFQELWEAEGASLMLTKVLQEASQKWAAEDPATFFTACNLMGSLERVEQHHWRVVAASANELLVWGRFEADSRYGVKSILMNCPAYGVQTVAGSIIKSLRTFPPIPGDIDLYAKGYAGILAEVSACVAQRLTRKAARILLEGGSVPGDAGFYVAFADAACEDDEFEFWSLGHAAENTDIVQILQSQASSGTISENFTAIVVGLLSNEDDEINWQPLFDDLLSYCRDSAEVSQDQASIYTEVLATLSDRGRELPTSKAFNSACSDGHLLRYFSNSATSGTELEVSARVAAGCFSSNAAAGFQPVQSHPAPQLILDGRGEYTSFLQDTESSDELVDEMSRIIIDYIGFHEICERAGSGSATAALAGRIARRIVELGKLNRLDPSWMLMHYGEVVEVVGSDNQPIFLERLDGFGSLITKQLKKFDVTEVDPSFVVDVLGSKANFRSDLADRIREYLVDLSDEDWAAALQSTESDALRLLSDYVDAGFKFTLSASTKRPLYEHFESVLQGKRDTGGAYSTILVQVLPSGSRNSLLKDIVNDIARSTQSSAPGLKIVVDQIGAQIFSSLKSLSTQEGGVIRNFVCRLIQEKHSPVVDLLTAHHAVIKKLLKKASAEDTAYFDEVLAEIGDDDGKWTRLRDVLQGA